MTKTLQVRRSASPIKQFFSSALAAVAIVSAGQTIYQESAHAQFTGQTQASQCDTSSFMVGDVNAAIDARFSDIPFISGPLCSLMDKAVLVTVLIGFVILIVAGFDSQRNEKKFMTALSPFFGLIFAFFFAWIWIGLYSINTQGGNAAPPGVQGGQP
ncbi:hypothetical protein ACSYAD_18455 [Acaryochloris marina NIES-2412]|uniref:hypothetical protein n=1 Tax=Acaryochloris marina TaxID=155978 RepID=UPI00405A45B7